MNTEKQRTTIREMAKIMKQLDYPMDTAIGISTFIRTEEQLQEMLE